ncbi:MULTISPECIES: antitoxin [Acetobacter]|nr:MULTISPECIES: DNA-binding protein [Acetobacter]GBR60338.1 virulence-associated protein [Acetobacter senegalensis DSM 18889]ATI13528.1 AbrB/MazE/SpoVT family DNA-binding domain-containing protein [Acetobacter pomorum]AXC27830.1 AbrB/MazE/SpoVT family DNA-binding domain-containing protein [Acetobacter sp. JWB]KAA8420630.1 AbrB/MazE/SpoVT family DNA-binding domain-containing protein [Acetobacter pomorum]KAA8430928.1 AbrB/MazE/SpoVT family DNA-binding domain-containing protein [Acetobacter pomo
MSDTAKIFMTGRSQAVRLPAAYRFDTSEVTIRRDPRTGDVILSPRPEGWSETLSAIRKAKGADLFPEGRSQDQQDRNPFSECLP